MRCASHCGPLTARQKVVLGFLFAWLLRTNRPLIADLGANRNFLRAMLRV